MCRKVPARIAPHESVNRFVLSGSGLLVFDLQLSRDGELDVVGVGSHGLVTLKIVVVIVLIVSLN